MDANFDPDDKYSWFFGQLSREETNNTLHSQDQNGVFLVRESSSQQGDFVLCVREEERISHYIINCIPATGSPPRYKIGDKEFGDMSCLLNFYKTHFLDTTTLTRPAPRKKLLTKFDFTGQDPEDLPFRRGEVLEVISQDEEDWWTARNSTGQVGQVPVSYTERIGANSPHLGSSNSSQVGSKLTQQIYKNPEINSAQNNTSPSTTLIDKPLPAKAIVVLNRIPNAYDPNQLRLEIGQIVTVTKMKLDGQWEGKLTDGRGGIFPFTHVRFLTEEELSNSFLG